MRFVGKNENFFRKFFRSADRTDVSEITLDGYRVSCYYLSKKFYDKDPENFAKSPTICTFRIVYITDGYMNDKLEKHVARLKDGDRSAFDYIYDRTNRSVWFAIFYIVRDKMHAEDIMQETYVKALSVIAQYRAGTNFVAWLRSIGRSLALNHLKRAKREVPTDFEADAYKYGTREAEIPYLFDLAARILSPEEYEIVMLCQVAGYKRREVSKMLGIPIGTVTWRNNEALKKLKTHLEEDNA